MWKDILAAKQKAVNNHLETLLTADIPEHETLYKAMNYSLKAGGKRIRPALFLMVLDLFGLDNEPYLDAACALECVHTYSLIHDDLPAMDNDDWRRGKPTNHKVFGAGMATQAGDGLLTYAFQLLAEEENLSAEEKVQLITLLARAAGPEGMVGGQAHDMESENKTLTLEELKTMDRCKTGALLTAPVDMACAIAHPSSEDAAALHTFAGHLGLLFQITDDLLDVNGHLDEMGKMPKQDEADHKSTFVTILGKDAAAAYAEKEAEKAKQALAKVSADTTVLADVTDGLLTRKK